MTSDVAAVGPGPPRAHELQFPHFKRESDKGSAVRSKEKFTCEHCGRTGQPPRPAPTCRLLRDATVVSRGRNSPETLRRKATCWRSSVTKPTPAAAQRGCGPPACRGQAWRSHMLCRSQCWRSRPTLQDAVHGHSRAPGGHPRPRRTHGRPPEHTRARTSAPPPRRVSAVPTTLGLCQPAEEQDITAGSHFCRPREEGRACREQQ